jgi:hypothetical protein
LCNIHFKNKDDLEKGAKQNGKNTRRLDGCDVEKVQQLKVGREGLGIELSSRHAISTHSMTRYISEGVVIISYRWIT